jgi:hypothetical protein
MDPSPQAFAWDCVIGYLGHGYFICQRRMGLEDLKKQIRAV